MLSTKYSILDLPISRNSTLIILDWDDTLFPTSWTMTQNIDLSNPLMRRRYMKYFEELDDKLSHLLKMMYNYGDIMIITNAMPEWIELSASILPKTSILLNVIEVISARALYQNHHNMQKWKKNAFRDIVIKKIEKNRYYNNILSIGDAEYEHNALVALYNLNAMPHKYLKSIKFVKSPNHHTLLQQFIEIERNLKDICKTPRHLDLEFR